MKEIGSDVVRLNYDFGNAFSYSGGHILPEEDFEPALPFAVHFHLKDMTPSNRGWAFTEIGKILKNSLEYVKNELKGDITY